MKTNKKLFLIIVIIGIIAVVVQLLIKELKIENVLTAIIEIVGILLAFIIFDKVYKPKDYNKAVQSAFNDVSANFTNDFRFKNIKFTEKELSIKSEKGKDYVKILAYDNSAGLINLFVSYKTARYFLFEINPKDTNRSEKIKNLSNSIYKYLKEQHSQQTFIFESPKKIGKNDIYVITIKVKEKQEPELFKNTIFNIGKDIIEKLQKKEFEI